MPNWTSNIIRVEGCSEPIEEFLALVRGPDDLTFDFNRIIAMPTLLRHTASGFRKFGDEECRTWYVINPDLPFGDPGHEHNERPFTSEEKAALADLGWDSWYDWSIEHWGTKWNACHVAIDEFPIEDGVCEIRFDTAWSAPFPVFRAIAARFPQLAFEFSWTDEDAPDVTHSMTVSAGEEAE